MDWLKKDIPFLTWHELGYLILLIILPNIFFWGLAFYTATSRPLINIDYIFTLLLLLAPWRMTRLIGSFFLIVTLLFDILMFVVQIFPFMDLAAIHYLWSFISIAPVRYIIITITSFILILTILGISLILSKRKRIKRLYLNLIALNLIIICCYVLMRSGITYTNFNGIMGRDNYYIVHSQSLLYYEVINSEFSNLMNVTPKLLPLETKQKYAEKLLKRPYSTKILYIIAESWGELKNSKAQHLMLQKFFDNKDKLTFIASGSFRTMGATVAGELRELCGLKLVNNGFALSKLDHGHYSSCLPEKLKQQGYRTIALHGTSGLLYDRTDWYLKAGFQQTLFGENFMNLRRCAPFKGVCDSELMNEVAKIFTKHRNEKIFFYWMTLTSHQPYDKDDIYNYRFNCDKFNIDSKGDACRNAQLNTQFFDDLAQLIQKPEMQGVEVVVVGDHQPPMLTEEDLEPINPWKIGYLHFKVK